MDNQYFASNDFDPSYTGHEVPCKSAFTKMSSRKQMQKPEIYEDSTTQREAL